MTEKELKLEQEYKEFIKTDAGKQWTKKWQKWYIDDDTPGNFIDYLYDFYPELLQ